MIGSFTSLPYFGGDGKFASNFAKNLQLPLFGESERMKTGKYSFKRGIIGLHFGEKHTNLPYPFLRNCGGHIGVPS